MLKTFKRYHFFYLRKGFYTFLRKISVKFAIVMALFGLGLFVFEETTPGMAFYFAKFSLLVSSEVVLAFFFVSETLLGLIPPDLFIVWAKQFASPYEVVSLLAILSYAAGLLAYYMGNRLINFRRIGDYINVRFEKQFKMLRSWGGFIIIVAALLPLPFSTMCLGAGMLKYSFRWLAILGMFRIVRFFAYAAVLYQVV